MTTADDRSTHASVGIVIVSHNSAHLLRQRLARWSDDAGAEVVVVDNASTDDSVAVARAAGVLTISMGANAGYAAACNRGAEIFRSKHPWIAFVNPDVDLHPADLARLVAVAPPEAVALAPLLVDENGRPLADVARPEPTLSSTAAQFLITARADFPAHRMHKRLLEAPDRWFEVPVTSGACLIVRTSALERGGFPESYFLNYEDIEFCIQLRAAGQSIVVDRDVPVVHARNTSSTGVGKTERQLEAARAALVFFARMKPRWQLPVASVAVVAGMALRGLRAPIRSRFSAPSRSQWATGTTLLAREALHIIATVRRGAPLPPVPTPLFIGRQLG